LSYVPIGDDICRKAAANRHLLRRVLYFNLGAHHIPHSGDIPNTLMHTSASSVMFTPFNFHDRDPSRRSVHGVTMRLHPDGHDLEYVGGRYEKGVRLDVVSGAVRR
jgi:primary-amine oxidase